MSEGNPAITFNIHRGKSFYFMIVSLAILLTSYILIYRQDHGMAIAVIAKWSLIFAICMNFLVVSIQLAGPQNIVEFYGDSFNIRFAQLQKMQSFSNSELESAKEKKKNILYLKFRGNNKELLLGLFQINPLRREELVNKFKRITEKNKVV